MPLPLLVRYPPKGQQRKLLRAAAPLLVGSVPHTFCESTSRARPLCSVSRLGAMGKMQYKVKGTTFEVRVLCHRSQPVLFRTTLKVHKSAASTE